MKAKLIDYIKMDCRRAFFTWKWPVAVLGIVVALFCTRDTLVTDVILWITELPSDSYFIEIALVLASIPYATSFCEDMEYKYDMQLTLRGTGNAYWISKVITTFFSSGITMFIAFVLDAIFYWIKYGNPSEENLNYILNLSIPYRSVLEQKEYGIFICLIGIQLACLASAMGVIGLSLSLFVRNRMIVYALPVAILFVWDNVAVRFLGLEVGSKVGLYSMGVTSIAYPMEEHMRWLYYMEILIVLLCCSMMIWVRRKAR